MRNRLLRHLHRTVTLVGTGIAVLLATVLPASAATQEGQSKECVAAALPSWTPEEVWVWKRLCGRQRADLNDSGRFGPSTDIDKPKSWSSKRVLRSSFIETILTDTHYSDLLTKREVAISGAWFRSPIDLANSSIPVNVYFWDSRFDQGIDLRGADIRGTIGFDGSRVRHELYLSGAKIGGSIFLRNGSKFKSVELVGADVGGNVEATYKSTFTDELDLNSAKIGGSVFLYEGSKFKSVDLVSAEVGQNVDAINKSKFTDELDLNGAKIGGRVLLYGGSKFGSVDLASADVGGNVEADASTFQQEFNLNGVQVGGSVSLSNRANFQRVGLANADVGGHVVASMSTFQRDLDLFATHVEGSVYLYGSKFAGAVICSGGTIEGALSLFGNGQHALWDESARIDLEGSTVNGIDDSDAPEAWPNQISLAGFVMKETHGPNTAPGKDFIEREEAWYFNWLGRDRGSSGQPYKQIETLLRSAGKRRVADAVAMQRTKNEYNSQGGFRSILGWLHRHTVGYGYRPERAIRWIVGLILIGWLILIRWDVAAKGVLSANLEKNDVTSHLILSAQRLIPLINFSKGYDDVDITSKAVPWWVRWYFYLHATLGYILAAFLLTALARITTT